MIRARGITKKYGSVTALEDVTLEIGSGEVVVLFGPNASGRTTLLNVLATLIRPGLGSVEIDGIDALRNPLRARRVIGFLAATHVFYDELTVKEHLVLVASCRKSSRATSDVVASALALFDLAGERRVGALSTGLRQRLALACALVGEPRILLLDGPTAWLDPWARERLVDSLRESSRRGAAIVLAANDLTAVWPVCHKVALLQGGKLRRVAEVAGTSLEPRDIVAEVSAMGDH